MGCFNSTAAGESPTAQCQQSGLRYGTSTPFVPGHGVHEFGASFLHTQGPMGMTWAQYVQSGDCFVDSRSGLLSGPWADCIEAAVHFEHTVDFSRLPEYAGGEGPAGEVLTALGQWLGTREDGQYIMDAAERSEEKAHYIEDHRKSDVMQQSCAPHAPPQPLGGHVQPHGMQSNYGYLQPCDVDPYAESSYTPGPTLLQQPVQNQRGASTGAKVALGVGAAAVGVAGGVLLADHAGDIGDAVGDAAGWVGEGVEDVGEFVGDVF